MKDLIQAIEGAAMFTEEGDRVLYEQQVIDLINTHMAGKVIVPVEPTDEMIEAFNLVDRNQYAYGNAAEFKGIHAYKAMLSTIGEE